MLSNDQTREEITRRNLQASLVVRGLHIGARGIIEHLRTNLHDRYHCDFSIVKELIQNADDGHATQCHIVEMERIGDATHPLLSGRSLIVANDGEFSENDEESICELGMSHRVAERGTVGKFGLGLKSVFHLCEAFFYFGRSGPEAPPKLGLVNPWNGMNPFYNAWASLRENEVSLFTTLADGLGLPRCFLLLLPLRLGTHRPSPKTKFIAPEV